MTRPKVTAPSESRSGFNNRSIYLDYNASAPVRPEVREAMAKAMEVAGNPSSIHAGGRLLRDEIEKVRLSLAQMIKTSADKIIFTSGGTESNALILQSLALQSHDMIIGATEHDSVSMTAKALGARFEKPIISWPVDTQGQADLNWLKDYLSLRPFNPSPPLIALMLANNETGVIQPIAEAADMIHEVGGWLHVDAVQALGKIPIDMSDLKCDSLSFSAHKIGGPQGVGALACRSFSSLKALWGGGRQERGLRPGTENTPGIIGFGTALATLEKPEAWENQQRHRDETASALSLQGAIVIGKGASRLPNTLCLGFPDWPSIQQVIWCDLSGIRVSAGSACSSGVVKPSSVLAAMGLSDLAPFSLRVSGGWATTPDDWSDFAMTWIEGLETFRLRHRQNHEKQKEVQV